MKKFSKFNQKKKKEIDFCIYSSRFYKPNESVPEEENLKEIFPRPSVHSFISSMNFQPWYRYIKRLFPCLLTASRFAKRSLAFLPVVARLRLVRANQNSLRKELAAERRHAWFSARGHGTSKLCWRIAPLGARHQPDESWNNARGYALNFSTYVSSVLWIWCRKAWKPLLVYPSSRSRRDIQVEERKGIILFSRVVSYTIFSSIVSIFRCNFEHFSFFPFDLFFSWLVSRDSVCRNVGMRTKKKLKEKLYCLLHCRYILTFEVNLCNREYPRRSIIL